MSRTLCRRMLQQRQHSSGTVSALIQSRPRTGGCLPHRQARQARARPKCILCSQSDFGSYCFLTALCAIRETRNARTMRTTIASAKKQPGRERGERRVTAVPETRAMNSWSDRILFVLFVIEEAAEWKVVSVDCSCELRLFCKRSSSGSETTSNRGGIFVYGFRTPKTKSDSLADYSRMGDSLPFCDSSSALDTAVKIHATYRIFYLGRIKSRQHV